MRAIRTTFKPTFQKQQVRYTGRPLEQLVKTNEILDNRYKQNKQAMDGYLDFMAETEVEDRNRQFVDARRKAIEDGFAEAVANNNFEFADKTVSKQARDLKNDRYLKGAIQSQAAHSAHSTALDKAIENGDLNVQDVSLLKAEANAENSKPIEVDENGTIKNVYAARNYVKDPHIQKQITNYADKAKADKKPITVGKDKVMWHNGAWMIEGTHKTINNERVENAIRNLVENDPANQAWFQQQNRLEDNSEIVRDENGAFTYDAEGQPIRDKSVINFKAKATSLYGGDKNLTKRLEAYNKAYPDGGFDINTMDEKQYELLYKNDRNGIRLEQTIRGAVNLIDYDEIDLNYKTDPLIMDAVKRRRDESDAKRRMMNSPNVVMPMLEKDNVRKQNSGEFMIERAKASTELTNSIASLQKHANSLGVSGKIVVTDNGVFSKQSNGSLIPLSEMGEAGVRLSSTYRNTVLASYRKKKSADATYNRFYNNMSVNEQNEMTNYIADKLMSTSGTALGKSFIQNVPDSVYKAAYDKGLIELPEGVGWEGYLAGITAGAGIGAALGVGIFSIPASIAGGAIGGVSAVYAGDTYGGEVKLKSGVSKEQLLNFMLSQPGGSELAASATNDYLQSGSQAAKVATARFDTYLTNTNEITQNNVVHGKIIGSGIPQVATGSKAIDKANSTANYDRQVMITNMVTNLQTSRDLEGNEIVYDDSGAAFSYAEVQEGMKDKNLKVMYVYDGTTPKRVATGNIPLYDKNGKKVGSKTFTISQTEDNPYYANTYLNNEEYQKHIVQDYVFDQIDKQSFGDANFDMGLGTYNNPNNPNDINNGKIAKITIKEIPVDKDKNPITDGRQSYTSVFLIKDNISGIQSSVNTKLEITQAIMDFKNSNAHLIK